MNKRLVQQILVESAISLFEERGYDPVTIDDISNHCNKNRTNFYHYFKSKEDLFLYLSQTEKDSYLNILGEIDDQFLGRPDKQLKHLLTTKMRLLYKSSFFKIALTNNLFKTIPDLRAIRDDFDRKCLMQYIRVAEEGINLGIFIQLDKISAFMEFYQKMQKGIESTLFDELDEDTFFAKYDIAAELAVKAMLVCDINFINSKYNLED